MTEPTRRRARVTTVEVALGIALVLALVLITPARPGGAAPAVDDPSLGAPPDAPLSTEDTDRLGARHGRSDLRLDLVARDWDGAAGQWEVVVRATLDSRAICLPIVFDCIVAPARVEGATLTDVTCADRGWLPSVWVPGRCVKQLLFAGHGQQFDFTYRTDVGSTPTQLDFGARFGRGVLPWILQPLASATLEVAMDAAADLSIDCGTDPVGPGGDVGCSVTAVVADPGDGPPPVDGAALAIVAEPASLLEGAELTTEDPAWSCAGSTCELDPGEEVPAGSAVGFVLAGTAASTQSGGNLDLEASLDYDVGPDEGQRATASAPLVVIGNEDTVLEVTKAAAVGEVVPGGELRWTITVDNVGFPGDPDPVDARDVVLTDVASSWVTGLVVSPSGGVGDWACDGATCRADSMPVGRSTFEVTARLSPDVPPGTRVVNQVDVRWANDVYGPDFPAVAGVSVEAAPGPAPSPGPPAPAPPAAAPAAPPARLAFTG